VINSIVSVLILFLKLIKKNNINLNKYLKLVKLNKLVWIKEVKLKKLVNERYIKPKIFISIII